MDENETQDIDKLIDFAQVKSVMHEGSGVIRIMKDERSLFQRRSSYFYLELINDTEG